MKKELDCQFFEDQLDALSTGELPADAVGSLRAHAGACPQCGMMLKMKEHLLPSSLEELETAVPSDHLDSMWALVEESILPASLQQPTQEPSPSSRKWLVPFLAAASVVFLFSTGFLASALNTASSRETNLARQIADLEFGLAELDARTEWIDRTARLAGSNRSRARALDYVLAGQETVNLSALLDLLGRLPDGAVIFQLSDLESRFRGISAPAPELRNLLTILDSARSELGGGDQVRAGEFARWLSGASIPANLELPKETLLELLSL